MLGGLSAPADPRVLCRRILRLAAQARLAVHKQHLVSGALLGQFAAPMEHRPDSPCEQIWGYLDKRSS